MDLILTRQELASALKMSPSTLDGRMAELRALGFPASLPGLGKRWSRTAVEAWINRTSSGVADPCSTMPAALPGGSVPHKLPPGSNTASNIHKLQHWLEKRTR